jgi:hypothetical protein
MVRHVRGRLGYTPISRLLVYATGGLAVAGSTTAATLCAAPLW